MSNYDLRGYKSMYLEFTNMYQSNLSHIASAYGVSEEDMTDIITIGLHASVSIPINYDIS